MTNILNRTYNVTIYENGKFCWKVNYITYNKYWAIEILVTIIFNVVLMHTLSILWIHFK